MVSDSSLRISNPILGTPLSPSAVRVLLCGAGELGKEVAIELQRYGVEVIAVDRYPNAPAMQVAHRSHVISMLDNAALRAVVELERPHYIVPEIEAIATDTLVELEEEGYQVIPTARAAQLTMNREGIRKLAAEELSLRTSPFQFASDETEFLNVLESMQLPVVVKPVMSSSGKGQSIVRSMDEALDAWACAQEGGRAGRGRVIVEGFVPFDFEITLLTVRTSSGTHFCDPIGHEQIDGDYRTSWQPQAMSEVARARAEAIALAITDALGGQGVFGVELFISGDDVIFSEVSPRPHDTGLVTLISQNLSEFALHARCILDLPIPAITQIGPCASVALLAEGYSKSMTYADVGQSLKESGTEVRLFGKPEVAGKRRVGVALAQDVTLEQAIQKATRMSDDIHIIMNQKGDTNDR